jgi:flagellar operon protein
VSVELNPALLPPGQASTPVGSPQTSGRAPATRRAADTGSSPGPSFADVLEQATGAAGAPGAGATGPSRAGASTTGAGGTEASPGAGTTGAGGAEPLRFSKHALERVQRRGIALDHTTVGRLQEGVGRAAGKGSRDSLVLVDGTAFVVSVPSRTVITAVGSEHMREHIFTNIDSAVIA